MDTQFRRGWNYSCPYSPSTVAVLSAMVRKQYFNGNVAIQKTANATKFERTDLHPFLLK